LRLTSVAVAHLMMLAAKRSQVFELITSTIEARYDMMQLQKSRVLASCVD
jgi:hypothetical protein